MSPLQNLTWRKSIVLIGLISFVLLLIFSNFKSEEYYIKLKELKKKIEVNSTTLRTVQSFDEISVDTINCDIKNCVVTCFGDVKNIRTYLELQHKCNAIELRIYDGIFPDDTLKNDWLEGNFNLSLISISSSTLNVIENEAFNQKAVTHLTELELNDVEIQSLTDKSFVGLNAIEKFSLVNKIESFSGNGFLKPMRKTLKKLVIKHVSRLSTDPGPWLREGNFPKLMTIVFNGSNFGGFIKAATFGHLKSLSLLMLNSCKIYNIADGAFDFMMTQILVLISLQNNYLKRLDGEYLSKVSVLKSIHIENNPWDCTCELEGLVREFKRYPEGFGLNSKCKTPKENEGMSLRDVRLDKCIDITTLPNQTSNNTSQSNSSTKNVLTTTQASEASSYLTTSSSSHSQSTTLSSESTALTPTTTEKIIITSETSNITPSIQGESSDTSSTENPIGSNSSTTSHFTTTEVNGASSDSTFPSPHSRSTTLSDETVLIECQSDPAQLLKYLNKGVSLIEISPPDGQFEITPLSQTSARLIFKDPTSNLSIIWFYDESSLDGSGYLTRIVGEFSVGCQSELDTSLLVEGLLSNQAYTFCLVKNGSKVVSPFNCQSYYNSGINPIDNSHVWLRNKDKPMLIGVFVTGIVIAFCVGLIGMFLTLRSYPTLLKGSKRVIVGNKNSGDVIIKPTSGKRLSDIDSSLEHSFNSAVSAQPRRFSEKSIQSGRSYMMANNYEDIEYRWKMNVVNDMIYANRVPKSPAPPLPKRMSRTPIQTLQTSREPKNILPRTGNDYGCIS